MTENQNTGTQASSSEHQAVIQRVSDIIQRLRTELLANTVSEIEECDLDCTEETPSMDFLRQLSDILRKHADALDSELEDQKLEMDDLRAAIAENETIQRRNSWRLDARQRILAGQTPDTLPMDGDMTFADYFAEIKQLVAELAQSTDLERSRAARNKEEQRTR